MEGTKDILHGKWHELKGQVRQQWGKLTDDDLTRMSGKTEELAGVLQQRYGYGKDQAEDEIHKWLNSNVSNRSCLLYTSDAADDLLCVDLGGRRIIKKKK